MHCLQRRTGMQLLVQKAHEKIKTEHFNLQESRD
jgi:hypothetical protein